MVRFLEEESEARADEAVEEIASLYAGAWGQTRDPFNSNHIHFVMTCQSSIGG